MKVSPAQKPWFFVLIVSVIGAILLVFVGEAPTRDDPVQAREPGLTFEETEDMPLPDEERRATLRKVIDLALPEDKSWLQGLSYVSELGYAEDHPAWGNPPASRTLSSNIVARQEAALAAWEDWIMVRVKPGAGFSTGRSSYEIHTSRNKRTFREDLPFSSADFGPFQTGRLPTFVWMHRPSGFLSSAKRISTVGEILLDSAQSSPRDLTIKQGTNTLSLTLEPVPFDPNGRSEGNGTSDRPSTVEVLSLERFLRSDYTKELNVTFNSGDALDFLRINTGFRYTAVLIVANQKIEDNILCQTVTDQRPVGLMHPELGLYAVATSGRTPLQCRVAVHGLDGKVQYRILAVGDKYPPFKSLVIAFLGRHLPGLKVGGNAMSREQIRSAVQWVKKAYGVQFTDEDVKAIAKRTGQPEKYAWLLEDN